MALTAFVRAQNFCALKCYKNFYLNPFSVLLQEQVLSELSPSQVAQLLQSSDIGNDTKLIDRVFDRLEKGEAVENVDEFFTQLTKQEQVS